MNARRILIMLLARCASTLAHRAHLQRIAASEPRLRAFCEPPETILARLRDTAGHVLVGIKDNIACGYSLPPARCGASLPAAAHAINGGVEARVVSRLRAAGATVAGKTALAEFAALAPPATRHPLDDTRSPGGSSSGSAAAVAAGFVDAALGTQTIGSIGRPAAFCGVAALAPTRGRVPTNGVDAYSASVDVVGALAKDMRTLTRVAAAIYDDFDDAKSTTEDFVLVVPEGPWLQSRFEPRAIELFEESLRTLADCPFVSVRRETSAALADPDALEARHRTLINGEFKLAHAERFERWPAAWESPSTRVEDSF